MYFSLMLTTLACTTTNLDRCLGRERGIETDAD